jgi:hypothetical protein
VDISGEEKKMGERGRTGVKLKSAKIKIKSIHRAK